MNVRPQRQSLWRALPLIGFLISEWQIWHEDQTKPFYHLAPIPLDASDLLPYPLDMSSLLALPYGTLDEAGVPYNAQTKAYPAAYHPTTIAQYALAQWNAYLTTKAEKHKQSFLIQANWLVAHEIPLADDAGGWPVPFPSYGYNTPDSWLSALTQGNGISVLLRAYRLTGSHVFLLVAHRVVRTFELDILDGGVSAPLGDNGVFFEEVAVYPASHILNGYILALFGLYDYVALTGDAHITTLIQRSLIAMHTLIDEFDVGYWSRYDLLSGQLASRFYHDLHATLLVALSRYSGCEHCVALAARWEEYQHSFRCRLYYFIISRVVRYYRGLRREGLQGAFFRILRAERQTATKNVAFPNSVPPVAQLSTVEREMKG